MKKFFQISLSLALSLLIANEMMGQIAPAKMSSSTKTSSSLERMKPLEPNKQPPPTPSTPTLPPPIKLPTLVPQRAEYLHPGILVFLNGRWEGSNHLLNLSNNIGVYVSIIKPENEILDISEDQIRKEAELIFNNANIKPQTLATEGKPPLPVFEIEIFVYPIERGYAACCNGRLFESVILERFKMDPNMAFQAITWEKQHLIVSPKALFAEQLTKTVQDIVTSFTVQFQAYERLKKSANL
jgi:hypothetical protein